MSDIVNNVKNNSNPNETTGFEYTYSAKQQQEIESIRKKYLPQEEDKMETLRRLDRGAEQPGTIWSIVVGVIGTLLLGIGMCCTMVWGGSLFIIGCIVGIAGIAVLSMAYPLYKHITRKERAKIADRIIELSQELSL